MPRRRLILCESARAYTDGMGDDAVARDSGIRSADRVLRTLDEIAAAPHGLTAADVAHRLDLSTATAYRLLGIARRPRLPARSAGRVAGRAVDGLGRAVRSAACSRRPRCGRLSQLRDTARASAYPTVFPRLPTSPSRTSPTHPPSASASCTSGSRRPRTRRRSASSCSPPVTTTGSRRYLELSGAAALTRHVITDERMLLAQPTRCACRSRSRWTSTCHTLACIAAPVRARSGRTVGAVLGLDQQRRLPLARARPGVDRASRLLARIEQPPLTPPVSPPPGSRSCPAPGRRPARRTPAAPARGGRPGRSRRAPLPGRPARRAAGSACALPHRHDPQPAAGERARERTDGQHPQERPHGASTMRHRPPGDARRYANTEAARDEIDDEVYGLPRSRRRGSRAPARRRGSA